MTNCVERLLNSIGKKALLLLYTEILIKFITLFIFMRSKIPIEDIIDKDLPELPRITRWNKEEIAASLRNVGGNVRLATGRFYTFYEYEIRRAGVLSTPLPGGTFFENLKFYLRPNNMRHRYNIVMLTIDDRFPAVYNILTKLGIPGYRV